MPAEAGIGGRAPARLSHQGGIMGRDIARMADMPELFLSPSRPILACVALIGALVLATDAFAQAGPPGPPPQGAPGSNPICVRLDTQLAAVDRGAGGDPAKEEQIRRYQDSASRQQAELDRVTMQAKRMGCESS